MIELRITFLVLALTFIFSLPHSYASETVLVTRDFSGREIKMSTGGTIQVELEQPGATGYTWEIQGLEADYFEVLSVKTQEPKVAGDIVGAPILKTWMVRAKKKRMSELRFLLYRPWEAESKAVDRVLIKVRIL